MECAICWKNIFGDFFDGSRISDRHWSTACKHYRKCDVIYRYLHIELIWCLLMVQYLQNNVIMKWTTCFSFYWLDSLEIWLWPQLHLLSLTVKKTPISSPVFHIVITKTSNIRRTLSFDLLTYEFSKRVSIIRRALYYSHGIGTSSPSHQKQVEE